MNKWTTILLLFMLSFGCKSKKKVELKDTSAYFPVSNYLQSEIKRLDTSMYRFIKIETVNGKSDTTDISREDIRKYAADFLNIPNLRDAETGSDYDEMVSYDSLAGRVFMSYTAYDKDVEVVKQDVSIEPGFGAVEDKVKTIYVEKIKEEDDVVTEKKMLWDTNRYFNIRTIIQKKNAAEQILNLKIEWNSNQWDQ
ncbi:MAG: hypothetical protein ACXWV0_09555 [Flavisolibacter sp.]